MIERDMLTFLYSFGLTTAVLLVVIGCMSIPKTGCPAPEIRYAHGVSGWNEIDQEFYEQFMIKGCKDRDDQCVKVITKKTDHNNYHVTCGVKP